MTTNSSYKVLASIVAAVALLQGGGLGEAVAQNMDLQQFQPMPDPQQHYLFGPSAQFAPAGQWSGYALVNVVGNPLVLRNRDEERSASIVSSQAKLHMMGSFTFTDWLDISLDLPLYLHQTGDDQLPPGVVGVGSRRGIGDARLLSRARFFQTSGESAPRFAAAALLDAHLPTGNGEALQGGDLRAGPTVVADLIFASGHSVGAHMGYQFRSSSEFQNLSVNDTAAWGISSQFAVANDLHLTAELLGKFTPSSGFNRDHSPTEFVAAAKSMFGATYAVGGFGLGLIRGYGTPDWRAFAGIGIPMAPAVDTPIAPTEPAPPPIVEPEPEPEPEPLQIEVAINTPIDNDVTDFRFPLEGTTEPGATVSLELTDLDGQPIDATTVDADGQGNWSAEFFVPVDGAYKLAAQAVHPEDQEVTAFAERSFTIAGDHCAHDDLNSCHVDAICTNIAGGDYDCQCHDGFTGDGQHCELEREPEPEPMVQVDEERQRIDIAETVHFQTNSDEIEPASFPLLNVVATVLTEHPHLERIRIEGHTDSRGSRTHNTDLSQRRAESVRAYLIERGIDADRLTAQGLGPDQPIADNDTDEGRALNRRVEFHILGEDDQ